LIWLPQALLKELAEAVAELQAALLAPSELFLALARV